MTRSMWRGLRIALLAALVGSTAGSSPPARNGTVGDRMAGLRAGHWVELEASVRRTGPALCSQLRPLAGDFLDDDYALRGAVKSVDPARQEFLVGRCRVRVTASTIYDSPKGALRSIMEVRPAMVVDVEGTLLQDGTLLAAEVDDETHEIRMTPGIRNEIEVTGKIERIDYRRQVLTVMGMEFQVSARTRLLSAIH